MKHKKNDVVYKKSSLIIIKSLYNLTKKHNKNLTNQIRSLLTQ